MTMLRSEFESMLAGSLQAGDANAEKVANAAVGVLAPYLNKSNQYFPEVDPAPAGDPPAPGLTEAQMAEIQAALNAAITAADKSAVEQGDSPKEVGSGDWEYTPEQHAEAQYQKDKQLDGEQKADYQALDVQAAPPETAPGTPEKRSLTAVLDQFYGGAEQTAIYGKLQALKDVTYTNPSCSFVADLGDWGQVTFSMCEWQTSLNVLGSLMVMACGFLWVLWFFMGRGDT